MKIEMRCADCGKGFLVDEGSVPADGGIMPCPACGATMAIEASPIRSTPARSTSPQPTQAREVCCPRCKFHFVPDAAPEPKPSGRPTLLVVEDMEYFLQMARDALGERYEVKTARTLAEAQDVLIRGGIDLLLLDMTLEKGEDGLRLLREPPGKICPVLLFTAQDESEMYGEVWTKLKALGVDDVIIKGMNMDEALQRKVAEMLGEPLSQDAFRR